MNSKLNSFLFIIAQIVLATIYITPELIFRDDTILTSDYLPFSMLVQINYIETQLDNIVLDKINFIIIFRSVFKRICC